MIALEITDNLQDFESGLGLSQPEDSRQWLNSRVALLTLPF